MNVPKTSFAMVQTANRVLEAQDLPIPDIDEDSALLQLEACGICGSDYEQFEAQEARGPRPADRTGENITKARGGSVQPFFHRE